MIFMNKYLLNSNSDLKLNAPLFVTWYQCGFSLVFYFLWYLASKLFSKLGNLSLQISFNTLLKVFLFHLFRQSVIIIIKSIFFKQDNPIVNIICGYDIVQ